MPDEIDGAIASDDTTPLSISEAANAYAGTITDEEPEEGQPEAAADPEGETEATDDDAPAEADEETDEGEAEDEGQAEPDDEEQPESEQGRFVADDARVKITNPDGTISFTTVAELKNGNLRDRDYRQKTMAHADNVKAFEAQSTAIKQREQQLDQQREYNVALIKSILPPQPDPSKADPRSPNYDPAGYQAEDVAYRQWAQHLTYLETEQQRTHQERQARAATTEKETADREWGELVAKAPELKDPKRVDRFLADVKEHSAAYGFKPEELKAIALDHRYSLVLKDAIELRKLRANKAKAVAKVENKPPVQKGGTRLDPTRAKARDSRVAMDRLDQSHSLKDGVAALLAIEKG